MRLWTIVALAVAMFAATWLRPASEASLLVPELRASFSPERRGIALDTSFTADGTNVKEFLSLAITEQAILDRFTLEDVVSRWVCLPPLHCQPGDRQRAALQLFRQWWSTQNTGTTGGGPFCSPTLFGFPYACDRAEGNTLVKDGDNPFSTTTGAGYRAVGLFNRIDLADVSGRDCGEYRIVFARRSGISDGQARLFINFEAVLPNPHPSRGLAGCWPIAQFWKQLDSVSSVTKRADLLWDFYFLGLPGFPPVVHPEHYGARSCPSEYPHCTGQVRTNQFMQGPWMLREFQADRPCPTCQVRVVPRRVAQSPYGELFGNRADDLALRFQDFLVASLPGLLWTQDPNLLSYAVPAEFTSGQSESCHPVDCDNQLPEGNYAGRLGSRLQSRIEAALQQAGLGNAFTAKQVVLRAQALSCAGCHELSRGKDIGHPQHEPNPWPESFGFAHVSEKVDGSTYPVSPFVKDALKYRKTKLAAVLRLGP